MNLLNNSDNESSKFSTKKWNANHDKNGIDNEHTDTSENINITMHMYNLIEYSNNYPDASESSWQFKRNESPVTNDGNFDNAYHR